MCHFVFETNLLCHSPDKASASPRPSWFAAAWPACWSRMYGRAAALLRLLHWEESLFREWLSCAALRKYASVICSRWFQFLELFPKAQLSWHLAAWSDKVWFKCGSSDFDCIAWLADQTKVLLWDSLKISLFRTVILSWRLRISFEVRTTANLRQLNFSFIPIIIANILVFRLQISRLLVKFYLSDLSRVMICFVESLIAFVLFLRFN